MMRATAALAAGLLVAAAPAAAHPHVWIEHKVAVLIDAEGRAYGLRQTWLFDEYFSVYELADTAGRRIDRAKLGPWREAILENLAETSWMTEVRAGEAKVALKPPIDADATFARRRITLSFTLPFAGPVPLAGLSYAVFDPSYYVDMRHAKAPDAATLSGGPAGCAVRVIPPRPLEELPSATLKLGEAADAEAEAAGAWVGAQFAEWGRVACP